MKKYIVILLCLSCTLLSAQSLTGWFSLDDCGFASCADADKVMVTCDVLNFGMQEKYSGTSVTFCPLHIDDGGNLVRENPSNPAFWTMCNISFAYNLNKKSDVLSISPYVAVNWLCPTNLRSYKVEGGVEASLYGDIDLTSTFAWRVRLVTGNVAAGIRDGVPYMSVGIKTDLLILALIGAVLS